MDLGISPISSIKSVPLWAGFNSSQFLPISAGESAFFMAEEFAFYQSDRNARKTNVDKRHQSTAAYLVYPLGQKPFAYAGFA